jgi:hypothetical protein
MSRVLQVLEDTAGAALLGPDWMVTPKLSSPDDGGKPSNKISKKPKRKMEIGGKGLNDFISKSLWKTGGMG